MLWRATFVRERSGVTHSSERQLRPLFDPSPYREHAFENFDYLRQPGAKAREPAFIAQAKEIEKTRHYAMAGFF
jgi:hypothetical protein